MKTMNNKFARFVCAKPHAEIVTLDQPLVDWLLSINTDNRAVKPSVVRRYARDIGRGEWEVTSQGIGVSKEGVLLDGQHRLLALRMCNYPPTPCLLVCGLNKSAQLKVDTHAKRSMADLLSVALSISSDHTRAAAVRLLAFVDDGAGDFSGEAKTAADLVPVFERYRDSFASVTFASKVPGINAPFIAACIFGVANGIPAEHVQRFVHGVATGEDLKPGAPELRLREKVRGMQFSGSRAQGAWFGYSARCLVAYILGESISVLQPIGLKSAVEKLRAAGAAYADIANRSEVSA